MLTPNLLSWQLLHYPEGHRDRRNLTIHAATSPLFVAGAVTAPVAFALGHLLLGAVALGLVVVAVAAQGRGHRMERNAPLPFRSPLDVVARLFVEQFVTFPRFVLGGGFSRAWREGAS